MGNMSYCRFENTHTDLEECVDALSEMDNFKELSDSENIAAERMYDICHGYIAEWERIETEES